MFIYQKLGYADMGIEKYIAAASLGLFVMFAGEMITLYHFLLNLPTNLELVKQFEPAPKILQFISIGIAPAVILTGVSFIMSKKYGSRPVSIMIIAGGVILLVGMVYANILAQKMDPKFLIDAVVISPPLFIAVSIAVITAGVLLFRVKKQRPKKEYF